MKINRIILGLLVACSTICPASAGITETIHENTSDPVINEKQDIIHEVKYTKHEENKVEEKPVENIKRLTDDEVNLISRVVMAEAEDEPYEGKIYVVDTILNRVDSKHFPNNVHDVIYQRSQFTSMWNGRYNRCQSNSKLNDMINEEYTNRKDSDIVFFTADHYGEYGRHAFKVGNHYFSTYK